MLKTPYYRTLQTPYVSGCVEEPDFTYSPYKIFCIETRLYPIIYKKLKRRDIELIFKTVEGEARMDLVIDIQVITDIINNKPRANEKLNINIKNFQEELDRILATHMNYCLINKKELYLSSLKKYSYDWFNLVMQYIPMTSSYNPFYVQEKGIFLSFNPNSDYKTAYNEVVKYILNLLEKWYEDGIVFGAQDIAFDWKLENLDIEDSRLYQPTWTDKRFAPDPVIFLEKRIKNEYYIDFEIPNTLIIKHYLALALKDRDFLFYNNILKIRLKDLDETQENASLINNIITKYRNKNHVKIEVKYSSFPEENEESIIYREARLDKPYVISKIISKTKIIKEKEEPEKEDDKILQL